MKPDTERHYHQRIARVIEAILVDPGAPHTLDTLASVAQLSPFHFHRIYRALTGESIAETVRRVRLARAARRLVDTADSVTEISLDVGYDSPQTFARAFRGFTGVSPSEFQARQKGLAMPVADATGTSLPPVTLTEIPPITALCLRHEGSLDTIAHTFQILLRTLRCRDASLKIHSTIGICYGDPEEKGSFSYLAGVLPTAPIEPPGAIEPVRVDGGLYATHRLVGPHALIAPTFRTLFGGWLPQSGYVPDDRPTLELYRNLPSSGARNESVTDLMIPIRSE